MSPTRENTIESLLDLPYVKTLIFFLNTIGAWPHEIMGKKMWFSNFKGSKTLLLIYVGTTVSAISYIKKKYAGLNIVDFSSLVIQVLINVITIQRKIMPMTMMYKNLTKDLFYKVHLFHFKNTSDYAMKMYIMVNKISTIVTILHVGELCMGLSSNNISPLYNSYTRGMFKDIKPENATYSVACFYDLPFDYETNFYGFLTVYVFNALLISDRASCFCVLDLYIYLIVFQLWAHIKILKHNLMTFPRPMGGHSYTSFYDEEESRNITTLLIESMKHYQLIKQFMDDLCMAYGGTVCCYLFYLQIIQCMLLLQLSEMSAEAFMLFGVVMFVSFQQLIQLAVYFELLASQSETIKDAVYEVPWDCMDTKNRKIVLVYLCYVQQPMQLKALGLVPVGVQTMASILKTTLSYYMLLRALSADLN